MLTLVKHLLTRRDSRS